MNNILKLQECIKTNIQNIEDQYPILLSELISFIDKLKNNDKEKVLSVVDMIIEFAHKYDFEIDLIGEAISSDEFFKEYIKKDCEARNIIPTNITKMNNW